MALYFAFVAFFLVSSVIYFLGQLIFGDSRTISRRLNALKEDNVYSQYALEVSKPFLKRLAASCIKWSSKLALRISPAETLEKMKRKLQAAGNPYGIDVGAFMGLKVLSVFLLSLFGIFLSLNKGFGQVLKTGLSFGIAGYLIPEVWLNSRVAARKAEIQQDLPDVLDLLTVSVEAGLGFDAAIGKVVEKSRGALAQEFARLLQEIRVGRPRREALRELSDRLQVEDFSTFTATLIQADQLGVSIGKILRIQSETMRMRRRQRAEEAAMKAPVKILIPMVFFIFPVLLIVLLGPAILNLITVFRESGAF